MHLSENSLPVLHYQKLLRMKKFNFINNITGWVVFAIATVVYILTVEETASFWDCGEFIAVSYKLMVPHPPGAPFFLLMGRFFSMFAPDVESVSFFINLLSVFASSFSILFLFWTIVLFGKKIVKPTIQEGNLYSQAQTIALMGAGVVGALAYTFSDSFWFSAGEAEVYGLSSFFTAFVIWAILKWDVIEDERVANKWIILTAYMMGLSIGVHLLNLTTIPALALLYYFKKNKKPTATGIIVSLAIGLLMVGIIMVGVIPGLPSIAGSFEIFFVNSLGMPFNSGFIFFMAAFIGALVYGIYYSHKERKEVLNLVLVCFGFILIGYSTYGIVPIRSNANPPIDENDPENLISFVSYLKREQYGDRPLLFGPHLLAERDQQAEKQRAADGDKGMPMYRQNQDKGEYEIYDYRQKPLYKKKDKMLLPRIYSTQPGHDGLYRKWVPSLQAGKAPSFGQNIAYMLNYQFGHMYFRYFMWNFAGRDGDDKESGWLLPWETNNENVPHEIRNNKSRSNFYFLPLILGIIGLLFQAKRDSKNFWVNMLLFFIMGLGLVIYLNSPPVEPRERDYIYVGSFYAFAIWIGLGVLAIWEFVKQFTPKTVAPVLATVIALSAPTVMGVNGWDNHNRSNRFHSIDQARNTLASCAPNAVLFTGGDNDTFPLWYVQDVEGFRTDVRVVVLSYFSTDWYIKQMNRKVYESEALSFTMDMNMYRQGKNDYIPLVAETENAVNLKSYIKLVNADGQRVQVPLVDGSSTAKLLSKTFFLDIDSAKVANMDFVPANRKKDIPKQFVVSLKEGKNAIFKNDMAILDLIATSDWERPVYFNNTSANTSALEVRPYLQVEGMAFRLMPYPTADSDGDVGEVNTEMMAKNVAKFQFRGFQDSTVFHDEEYRKFGANTRNAFYRLASAQQKEGKNEEALKTLNSALEQIPDKSIPYSYFMPRYVELYNRLGEEEKSQEISDIIGKRSEENLEYMVSQRGTYGYSIKNYDYLRQKSLMILQQLSMIYRRLDSQSSADIARLEAQKVLGDESATTRIQELQTKKAFYGEQAKKYTEIFQKYAPQFR
ncbi:MAG: hypothetical protein ACI85I_001059 [Arenicella sp.]